MIKVILYVQVLHGITKETKAPSLRSAGVDGLHLSNQQVWNNFMLNGVHQDFYRFYRHIVQLKCEGCNCSEFDSLNG